VREEAQVERHVDRARRLEQAALDVDHVGDGLKRDEAQAHGQRQREQRQPQADRVEHPDGLLREEAVVLEDPEHAEVEGNRGGGDVALAQVARGALHVHGAELVHKRYQSQEQAEARIRGSVEDVARHQDERLPRARPGHERPRQDEHQRKEDREFERGKDHAPASRTAGE